MKMYLIIVFWPTSFENSRPKNQQWRISFGDSDVFCFGISGLNYYATHTRRQNTKSLALPARGQWWQFLEQVMPNVGGCPVWQLMECSMKCTTWHVRLSFGGCFSIKCSIGNPSKNSQPCIFHDYYTVVFSKTCLHAMGIFLTTRPSCSSNMCSML